MADKMEPLTEEQQKHFSKAVGDARVKEREKAKAEFEAQAAKDKETADQAALVEGKKWQVLYEKASAATTALEARIKTLEPLEKQVQKYEEDAKSSLKDRIKELGEAAKTAVDGLPKGMAATTKLAWLSKNVKLFQPKGSGMGTPIRPGGKTKAGVTEPYTLPKTF